MIELSVEKLVPGGKGLARFEGKVVFVPGTLPGEKILADLVDVRKDYARAEVREILTPSPDRVTPVCPVAGYCGGCDWQHIDYAEQLRQKVHLTEDALRRLGGITFEGLSIETGSPWRYRNRVQLHRGPSGETGFLARNSHEIVSAPSCPVAHPALDALLTQRPKNRMPARFVAWAHSRSADEDDVLESGEAGENAEITVSLLGRPVRFDLKCFFQSNLSMLEKLIPYALEGLEGDHAMDLYGGVGVFGVFLKERFRRVVTVEENPAALEFARRNLGAGPHVFLQGRLENLVKQGDPRLLQASAEAIVVDPPRSGLDAAVRGFLTERNSKSPAKLVYVSCNPVTLARDLKDLLAGGFKLNSLRLFDFYPQTSHVEAVARLQPA